MFKILIAEDDRELRQLFQHVLTKNGYAAVGVSNGEEALAAMDTSYYDLIISDIMMPKLDGLGACQRIRQFSTVPIIMLTAKGETTDKITGLDMGADDYVTKPFDVKELIARVHAVMRRSDNDGPAEKKLTFDKLIINLDSYELVVNGVKVDTPPKEMELLYHLAASPNRVFTRNQLLDEVWGFDYFGDSRTVDVHIKRLREKLEGVSDKWCLKTVWGVGYKFEVTE